MNTLRLLALAGLILVATFLRLAPLPSNFTPIAAIALFSGAILIKPRWLAMLVPLASLLLSDLVLGFHATQPFVYLSYALIAFFGFGLINRENETKPLWAPIAVTSLSASAVFFLISNFGVWVEGLLYPRTIDGLVNCYLAAVPFFWNTLLGDLIFTIGIFGAWALVVRSAPQVREIRGR